MNKNLKKGLGLMLGAVMAVSMTAPAFGADLAEWGVR